MSMNLPLIGEKKRIERKLRETNLEQIFRMASDHPATFLRWTKIVQTKPDTTKRIVGYVKEALEEHLGGTPGAPRRIITRHRGN